MKKIKIISAFAMLFFLTGNTIFSQSNQDKKGFALLELYTSEGCSSCPPADELLGKIQNELKDKNVYVLSYHVDYWDKQGWKDIFSNADFTKRQYDYAKYMEKDPIYTPQVIINGKIDYVGSQETSLRNGIKSALSKPVSTNLSLEASQNANSLSVNYNVESTSKNSRLLIAIVQKEAKSNVKRGENAHRVLSHYQIVRNLQFVDLNKAKKGTALVHLPKNYNTQDFEIIGFVQDMNSGAILEVKRA
ncbi:DUF1223 domain-containing protein [Flavobacterium johnsoniae]|uniref:DUF1223 domain-containing protein n=1 Tax=Flavobacterium johnsoniae (strain ATCC 17061 / DSM 2064 / JCM 8514 / BCRC 14874 / CCUG 350202 / NBRC 14942 / NCIMB 11054 / UW101) TaxID=376686 RepID=A5FCP9_FLAJ1|nr:DUF1223 domain-containing protein [Flavobacterium johnsoniae]ABQ07013.1 protein of unknown function DUF1223 [Flavobacterium johnsoniae UW101]OXE98735.1 DUF1223 domain-containing protein [Flavobacterium johnsoniae UW101]WQG81152.1 DUF1223 domain-containing protein [Flavobacterium johnsoniae UW101]SHL33247.1 Protein of unknown function [Flavobacterium johnsoniae]